ncbi:MAG: efflux RND transporter periplasmic adaptor subunit [Gemmataceae bacterium]
MSERNAFHRREPIENGDARNNEGGLRAPPGLGLLGKAWWWFHFVILVKLARLRFIAVLVAIGGVIAYWDTLNAYYEKWTRPLLGAETAVRADTEYWCPMHPTIVRDHPDKCPICAMPLSKRKKGVKDEQEALPPGVTQRVQITPYKIAVAGIETAEIGYRSLTKEIAAIGFVEFDERKLARISVRPTGKSRIDKLFVNVTGQHVQKGEPLAELYSPDLVVTVQTLLDARQNNNRGLERMARDRLRLWGVEDDQIDTIVKTGRPITHLVIRAPIHGHIIKKYQVEGEYVEEGARLYDVADLSTVWIEAQVYEDELAFLKLGLPVFAEAKSFPNRQFKGEVAFLHPHLDASTRTLKVRFDMDNPEHELRPGMYATVRFQSPVARLAMLREERRQQWSAQTAAELTMAALVSPGLPAAGVGLTSLLTAATEEAIAARDLVLAAPESAVIDTGSRQFVYREAEPDVFDQLEVQLGPRSGAFYPVRAGLRFGDRVATTGSFLIDAETRLTAGAASTYFGASGGPRSDRNSATTSARPSMTRDEDAKFRAMLSKLSSEDRPLAALQGYCPVLGNRLGSMGPPVSVVLQGQKTFLCCKMCVKKAKANEKKTLARAAELTARAKTGAPRPSPASGPGGKRETNVKANLAKLSAEDRRLAEEQKYCPVETDNLLGSMGPPVSLEIKGQKVFLCCKGCKDDALADPEQTLTKVKELKDKAASRDK